jgi:hypothetical protein
MISAFSLQYPISFYFENVKKVKFQKSAAQTIKSLLVFSFMVVGLSQRHSSKLGGYRF